MPKRVCIGWYFVLLGMILGNWTARMPELKAGNRLSNTTLGVALVFGAIGAIITLPIVTRLNERFGSAVSLLIGSATVCMCLIPVGIMGYGLKLLIPAVLFLGFAMALCDISMTAQAVLLEKRNRRNSMGSFHALASAGGMIGVLIGGTFAYYKISPFVHFLSLTALTLPMSVLCFPHLFRAEEEALLNSQKDELLPNDISTTVAPLSSDQHGTSDLSAAAKTQLVYLCVVGFLGNLGEGSIADWTTIYLTDTLHTSPLLAAAGFASFELMLTLGRLYSDHLNAHFTRSTLIHTSGFIAAIGIALVVIAPSLPLPIVWAVLGLGLAGAGLSGVGPIVASSAGNIPGATPAQSFAYITSVAYFGFMVGPPCFGGLADIFHGLRWSLLLLAGLVCLIFLLPCRAPENQYMQLQDDIMHCDTEEAQEKDETNRLLSYTPYQLQGSCESVS